MLRELALRLATFPGDPRVMNPHLFVGKLPQPLPVEIPLLENTLKRIYRDPFTIITTGTPDKLSKALVAHPQNSLKM